IHFRRSFICHILLIQNSLLNVNIYFTFIHMLGHSISSPSRGAIPNPRLTSRQDLTQTHLARVRDRLGCSLAWPTRWSKRLFPIGDSHPESKTERHPAILIPASSMF